MTSAFGVDHDVVSKGLPPGLGSAFKDSLKPTTMKATWHAMGTGEKTALLGGSAALGGVSMAANKKRTGRFTGNGGLVGVAARKTGLGYQKSPITKSLDTEEPKTDIQANEVLDNWLSAEVPEKTMPRYVRNEKGQFLSAIPNGQARDISHLVEKRQKDPTRGNKPFGSPAKTAAVAGAAGALLVGRGRANRIGLNIAQRGVNRSAWSAGRAASMPEGKLKNARLKYAGKLREVSARGPGANQDVREWMGRATVGGAAAGVAGGAVYTRRKLTPKENR